MKTPEPMNMPKPTNTPEPQPSTPEPMIQVRELCKRFGRLAALDGVTLQIATGRTTAVLGPNGAGKTTLIKSILGLVRPDAGEIVLGGERLNGTVDYRARIGYMPQIARYPENLTAREIIRMIRDLRSEEVEVDLSLVEALRVEPELDKPFRTLSGGNRQKVSAVLGFLFRPEILFLDEPTAGLDPVSSSVLKDRVLAERDRGRTVVLTSHILSEVQELADTVIYLDEGKVKFEAGVRELMDETGEPTLERAVARRIEGRRPVSGSASLPSCCSRPSGGGERSTGAQYASSDEAAPGSESVTRDEPSTCAESSEAA